MARGFAIPGQCLVSVAIGGGALQELGLSDAPIVVSPRFQHLDLHVDAFGQSVPNQQFMGGDASIVMTLVHFDSSVLQDCLESSMAGSTEGTLPRAGVLMGTDLNGAGGSFYISLTISSPVQNLPWVFPTCYLADNPVSWPLGAERSIVQLNWRAIAYAADPQTSAGVVLWHH